ncbi:hypothetical protein N7493_010689 [Penicillium malachiteum]|uniref:Uncharacterized protein n=1 Tax=Penicillium malachiteum TaxID=1324776 RepID=A0AAD6MRR6_9EURO|nr:hypothetical protein N7493_010689 [Penicillium malachiteum]
MNGLTDTLQYSSAVLLTTHLMLFFSLPSWLVLSAPQASRNYIPSNPTLPIQYILKREPTWLTLLTPAPPYRSGRVRAGAVHSPSVKTEQISDNKDVKKWIDNYLGVGEWVMDQSVAVMGSSSWFERRR